MAGKQRVLVVDDDREIVRLLRGYLEQAGYGVLTAYDGQSALQTLRYERPDLLLLDLMLPERDGWEICRQVRADPALAALPIIMITARVDDVDKIVGLELGADDYVTKPFNPREVVARVHALFRRARLGADFPSTEVIEIGPIRLDLGRHAVWAQGVEVELTPTEFTILQVMMQHPGYAFTRSELIQRGLGYEYEGLERTLDSHIKNLRQKIEADPRKPEYIETVYGVGYRFRESPAGEEGL